MNTSDTFEQVRKRKVMKADIKNLPENAQPSQRQKGTDRPLAERLAEISRQLRAKAGHDGHEMGKEEIDRMWGHP